MSTDPNNYPKKPYKKKPRNKPLPKAKQSYLEAEEILFQQLQEFGIGYERKFQPLHTKNWRFDFHIVRLKLLIEIAGSPWSVGRGGKKIANSFNKHGLAEDMGYSIVRLESARSYKIKEDGPLQVQACFAVQWLKDLKRHSFNGSIQTIPTD